LKNGCAIINYKVLIDCQTLSNQIPKACSAVRRSRWSNCNNLSSKSIPIQIFTIERKYPVFNLPAGERPEIGSEDVNLLYL